MKMIMLSAVAMTSFAFSSAVAQTCGGLIVDLTQNVPVHGNTCGSHLEITSGCQGGFNGKGVSVFRMRLASGHSGIRVTGIGSSFSSVIDVANAYDGSGCGGYCYSPDVDEPYAYILPSTTPAGTYYVTVGDLTDESPGCGDFTVEADGDFNLEEQTVRFTSPRPTNAQTGGSYIVTAEASSGLPVFIDTNSLSTSLCEISGHTSGSVVTYTHPGTCMIRANQPGDDTYDSAFQASQTFDVAVGSPAKLEFDQAPSSTGVAGVALAAAVVVNEVDAYRNLETSDSVSTISLTANGPGQMRNEPITATLANGSARFDNDLIFDTAGNYSITAVSNASGAPSATSSRISISPNTGALLKFLPGLPSAVDQGAQIGPITVIETDDFGNRAAADNSTSVIFRVDVCGDTDLGLGVLTAGEVVFAHLPILHKVRDVSLIAQPAISPGPTPANARTSVIPNANYIFASGSELCEP